MGAGSSALIWYGLCFGFVAFVVIVSTALIFYGQLIEARRRAARPETAPLPSEAGGAEAKLGGSALDRGSADR
jgi:hypothetical protein